MSNKLIKTFLEYEDFRSSKKNETNAFNDALQLKEQHNNNLNKQFNDVDFLIARLMFEGVSLNDAISFIKNINEEEYANLIEGVVEEIENYGEDVWFEEIASYLEERDVYVGKGWAVTDKGITRGGEAGREAHTKYMGKKFGNGAAAAQAMRAAAQRQRTRSKSGSTASKKTSSTPKPITGEERSKARADAAASGQIQGVGRGKNSWADEKRKARAEAVTGGIGVKPEIKPGTITVPGAKPPGTPGDGKPGEGAYEWPKMMTDIKKTLG